MLLIGNAIATIIRRMKAKQYFVARTSKILTVFCGVAFFGRVGVPHCLTPAFNPLKSSRGEGQNGQKWYQICIRLLGRGRSHTLHSGDRQGRCKARPPSRSQGHHCRLTNCSLNRLSQQHALSKKPLKNNNC